jgi:hypothetical protein
VPGPGHGQLEVRFPVYEERRFSRYQERWFPAYK